MMIYLAAPYSGPKAVVEQRMQQFCQADAMLMKLGHFTVSPLLKHFTLNYADLPGTWEYWKDYSYVLMKQCTKMVIIPLDGWRDSVGVIGEIEMAESLSIPVFVLERGELIHISQFKITS